MENKNSNILIKTIIFILAIAVACLIYFGLGKENKTDMELVAFGFIMFGALVAYITILIPSLKQFKKLEGSDVIAGGVLYLLATIITNSLLYDKFQDMKSLVIVNIIEIIVFMIIICSVMLRKKR